jgi:hypothetical protein
LRLIGDIFQLQLTIRMPCQMMIVFCPLPE